ncbi:MAG: sigma-70 family RNA polymerase sigma factor [Clostridia bacterium]|nr:sigma-70 family RNA polymerase sigma factor [Clostridia bacterium]
MNQSQSERHPGLHDDEIIQLYWNRDEIAISATDEKYGRYLFAIAYNVLHDKMDCEECLNDTYLSTWNLIPPKRPSVFQVFLSRITRNIAIDKYRMSTAEKRIPSELTISLNELDDCIPSVETLEQQYHAREIGNVLNSYLRTLSRRSLTIFISRYYFADSISDIAAMLKVNESTVFRSLTKIREGLKERLIREGYWNE